MLNMISFVLFLVVLKLAQADPSKLQLQLNKYTIMYGVTFNVKMFIHTYTLHQTWLYSPLYIWNISNETKSYYYYQLELFNLI